MYKERFVFSVQHFAVSHMLLVGLFWFIRLFEWGMFDLRYSFPENSLEIILYGLAFDAWFCCLLALCTFPLYVLLYLLVGSITRFVLGLLFIGYLVVYTALVSYFVTTQVPLSSDFWGYSMADIETTVSSSAGLSIQSSFPFIIVIGLLLFYYLKAQEILLKKWALITFYAVALGGNILYLLHPPSQAWFTNEKEYNLSMNKMEYFTEKTAVWYWEKMQDAKPLVNLEFPFMHPADTADVLSPFFNKLEQKPNIVFLIIEGLGGTFVGPNAHYGGCTPFLDSLAQHSLYWQNTLSTTGRTFGVLPSLLGSLPYGSTGFMETGAEMPNHLTLLKLLKQQGYATHYFYGGNANFDLQDVFLEAQGIDYVLSEVKFPPTYKKLEANSEGFSWGYSDEDVFKRSLELFPDSVHPPTVSVYLTLNTHEPFKVPNQEKFLNQLKLVAATKSGKDLENYTVYADALSSLLYTDNALRNFFTQYRKRPDYKNTIFIITGDHRMVPVPQANRLDRFHVPLIVFSPLLSRTQTFSAINTHHDITPTLLPFLEHQTDMVFPKRVHWIGNPLDTTVEFNTVKKRAFMRNKSEIIDYIDGNYFLSEDILYRITPAMDLEPLQDLNKANELKGALWQFKQNNLYAVNQNKLYDSKEVKKVEFVFTAAQRLILKSIGADTLNPEQLYAAAQFNVQQNRFDTARLIAKKALLTSPNYTDIRLLLGRTHAWDGNYDSARTCFKEAVRRVPNSEQAWRALIENEIKFDHNKEAVQYANEAYAQFQAKEFLALKKKAQQTKANVQN
jgi:lipoteichoic acid synthase